MWGNFQKSIRRHQRGIPGGPDARVVWDFYPLKLHGYHEMINNLHVNISIIKAYWQIRSDTYLLIFDIDPSCLGSSKSVSTTLCPPLVSLYGGRRGRPNIK